MQQEPAEALTRRALRERESRDRGSRRRGAAHRASAQPTTRRAGPDRPPSRRGVVFTAIVSSFGLVASLIIVSPAQAEAAPRDRSAASEVQQLRVGGDVSSRRVIMDDYSASTIVGIVSATGREHAHEAAVAVANALSVGGVRAAIVRAALDYFGDPYVLGGASHAGIDCSGLTMLAYASVGIAMAHYVPTQDAIGTPVTEAEAQPGDLVVFDNEEHIGIYVGDGMVLHAPATGRTVSIEPVSVWQPMGIHFTRILAE